MSQVAILVEYVVKPENRAAFEKVIRAHAEGTLADERGCVRFDVLVPRGDAGTMMVYEVYRDQRALDEHNKSPRLPRVREAYKDLIENKRVVVGDIR